MQEIVAQKDVIAELDGFNVVHIDQLSFEHCPIIDCGVTDDSKVVALSQALVQAISEGQVIYLHCWGGHGRTGTVVCIMLHLMYGVSSLLFFGMLYVCCFVSGIDFMFFLIMQTRNAL